MFSSRRHGDCRLALPLAAGVVIPAEAGIQNRLDLVGTTTLFICLAIAGIYPP
ncbi:MAG: hypothetical protein WC476_02230 [Phycisphaerae bacterium]